MSYSIELYRRDFVQRALASGSGDWTDSAPIPETVVQNIVSACIAEGFVAELHPPGFADFLRLQGVTPSEDYGLHTSAIDACFSVFPGSLSFSIDMSPTAMKSIEFCSELAQRLANRYGLAYHDPQAGVTKP